MIDRIDEVIGELRSHRDREWAWKNFLPTVERLIVETNAKNVIEIGGGRSPSFSREKIELLGLDYVSNDISARELGKAPDWVGKAEFDVQTTDLSAITPYAEQFDIVYSKMVMEHVKSFRRAYANIYRILRPGGIAISFHPVLYASPFLFNFLLPDVVSRTVLKAFHPDRTDDGTPKFPAYYSGCAISRRVTDRIEALGFRRVWQVPFWGHAYYRRIPLIGPAHKRITKRMMASDMTLLASFSYTIVQK